MLLDGIWVCVYFLQTPPNASTATASSSSSGEWLPRSLHSPYSLYSSFSLTPSPLSLHSSLPHSFPPLSTWFSLSPVFIPFSSPPPPLPLSVSLFLILFVYQCVSATSTESVPCWQSTLLIEWSYLLPYTSTYIGNQQCSVAIRYSTHHVLCGVHAPNVSCHPFSPV